MQTERQYVGIDVSKTFFDVAIEQSNGSYLTKRYDNQEEGFKQLRKALQPHCCCVMEVTGSYFLPLANFLYQSGVAVSVINPLVIRRFGQMRMSRTKTDVQDAILIAQYGKSEQPDLWDPPAEWILQLQQLRALTEGAQQQLTRLLNQEEAFNAAGKGFGLVTQSLEAEIIHQRARIEGLESTMQAIINREYKELQERLTSIPGIGPKTAMMLIIVSAGFEKFDNAKQLSSYLGLCPRIYQSGSSVKGRGAICKMGMEYMRKLLYLCAWSAKKYNKACRELYERLLAKGKNKKLALIAVANKLLKQALAIANKNEMYKEI